MSLQVWLPLNGDLHNQGLSNITVTNNGATVNTSGKIGSCYEFGSNTYLQLGPIFQNGNQNFSISYWLKLKSIPSTYYCILCSRTSTASTGVGIWVKSDKTFIIDIGARWNTSVQDININQWYHVAIISSSEGRKLYINGIETSNTSTIKTNPTTVNTNSTIIGAQHSSAAGTVDGTYLNGYLNDVRIYDHALSAKEVEEIAKGLVLHYKLDNNGLGGENLALLTASKIVTATATGTDVSAVTTLDYGLLTNWSRIRGQTITISCDIELINAVNTTGVSNYRVGIEPALKFTDNTAGYYGIWIGLNSTPKTISQRYTKSYTLPDKDVQSVLQNGMYIQHLTNGSATIKNIKVELGSVATRWSPAPADLGLDTSIIYDSSGYGNNGIITGNLTTTTSSPRYSIATNFDGSCCISRNCPSAEIKTLSCWCKTSKNKSTTQFMVADSASSMCISFYNGTIIGVFGTTRSTGSKCTLGSEYKENDWNHIVVVKTSDDGQRDIYCNGVKLTPASNNYWNATTGFWVGTRDTSQTNPFYGDIVDVRAYATALTENQVKELYNTSMSIDKNGNIHVREVVEI